MEITDIARQIGKEIQKDSRYTDFQNAKKIMEGDKDLSQLMSDFENIRTELAKEAQNENRDEEKLNKLNEDIKACYEKIMSNQKMIDYNVAQSKLAELLRQVTTIISKSAEGENPDTINVEEACTGSCETCAGCH